jgi:hypothetical protein
MGRYILRYGKAAAPAEDQLQLIRTTPGLTVIDESPQMMLVDAEDSVLRDKIRGMAGWSIHPEQQYPMPGTRQKID